MFRKQAAKNWEYHYKLIEGQKSSYFNSCLVCDGRKLDKWENALNDAREFLEKSKADNAEGNKYESRLQYLDGETYQYNVCREDYNDPFGASSSFRGSGR